MSNLATLLIVTSSYPLPNADGREAAGSFVADLATEISKHKRVAVVAPGPDETVELISENLIVYRYPAPAQALSSLRLTRPLDAFTILKVIISGRRVTERAARQTRANHVLALWALPCGSWARYAARRNGIGYSVWTLGSDIWSLGRLPLVRSFLKDVLSGAIRCFSDGMALASETERLAGRPVTFLPSTRRISGKPRSRRNRKPPFRLTFLGRWHPNKGLDLLLDALAKLSDPQWQRIAKVDIYGGGPQADMVYRKISRLAGTKRPIQAHGYVSKAEAEAIIQSSDYLIIPSRIESIPLVFSDAVKLGCPVIVNPVGDLGQLVNKFQCGIVSSDANVDGLLLALSIAINNSPQKYIPGLAAAADAFDIDKIARTAISLANTRIN